MFLNLLVRLRVTYTWLAFDFGSHSTATWARWQKNTCMPCIRICFIFESDVGSLKKIPVCQVFDLMSHSTATWANWKIPICHVFELVSHSSATWVRWKNTCMPYKAFNSFRNIYIYRSAFLEQWGPIVKRTSSNLVYWRCRKRKELYQIAESTSL